MTASARRIQIRREIGSGASQRVAILKATRKLEGTLVCAERRTVLGSSNPGRPIFGGLPGSGQLGAGHGGKLRARGETGNILGRP